MDEEPKQAVVKVIITLTTDHLRKMFVLLAVVALVVVYQLTT